MSQAGETDVEKNISNDDDSTSSYMPSLLVFFSLLTYDFLGNGSMTASSSSEPSLLKPKPVEIVPNRDILPGKAGTKTTRYLECKS